MGVGLDNAARVGDGLVRSYDVDVWLILKMDLILVFLLILAGNVDAVCEEHLEIVVESAYTGLRLYSCSLTSNSVELSCWLSLG